MAPSPIRVLHLDDSALDAELIRERIEFEDAGPWRFEHVTGREGFEAALAAGGFDLILTDYNIPGYDGMAAVREARARQPDAPIIVISGTLSEEDAVEVLRAGAVDYLIKQRLQRLSSAARRALEEASERRLRREVERRIAESEERFRAMFEQAAVGIAFFSPGGERLSFNQRYCEILGYAAGELGPGIQPTHPEDLEASLERRRQVASGEVAVSQGTKRYTRKDATVVWCDVTNSLVRDGHGRPMHILTVIQDATARMQAEAALRELNAELERRIEERTRELSEREARIMELNADLARRASQAEAANRELEAFSYSVSHDLRAPLHAVSGYASALAEEFAHRLDDEGRRYLERVRAGAARMDELIDDMLSLSRISRADLAARPLDVSALARVLLEELREREPARACRLDVQPGMQALADAALLRIALTNLLGNAWKFSSKRESTVIEVGRLPSEGLMAVFFVRDQGAGFDPAHADKLFGAFRRLHSEKEFPGTGIGLATVRRVIERHGGNVWAEGTPGAGATFFFSLPREGPASGG